VARRPREDHPGSLHHVTNRGISRRTLFEGRTDSRLFLAAVARRVRAGELELHAFCIMGTHYHMLVGSPLGRLAEAMHRIQLSYSRAFNRSRRRDGPLVRGRYRSKPVRSLAYRRVLVRYIDSNPVRARLADAPGAWPYGSAFLYRRGEGPPWLERSWVESEVLRATGAERYEPHLYEPAFGGLPTELDRIVEARMECRGQEDPLEELLKPTPGAVLDWMRRKAALADGTRPFLPVCDEGTVAKAFRAKARKDAWTLGESGRVDGWEVVLAGLSVELCGSTQSAVAARLSCSDTHVGKLLRLHRRRILDDPGYGERVERLARELLGVWEVGG
jgi:REP element-mobilizing transposase RayT